MSNPNTNSDRNWRQFVFFRVLFFARFYYPVMAILFLDLGITPVQYTLLNFAWALAIVLVDVPAGVIAEHINLTGDYVWQQNRARSPGKFRPLRVLSRA